MTQEAGETVEGARDAEIYEAATLLGADPEMTDVSFALGAQAEAAMADG